MTLSMIIPQIPSISKIRNFLIVIQKLQNELGLQVSSFPDLRSLVLRFYSRYRHRYLNCYETITQEELLGDHKRIGRVYL